MGQSSKRNCEEINLNELLADPGTRRRVSKYNPNDREKIRRAYLQIGPHQPRGHKFRQTAFGKMKRRFIRGWFDLDLYKPWLEYNVTEDAAFCLYCYLCDDDVKASDVKTFITKGFNNWKKSERFKIHMGGPGNAHNQAQQKCLAFRGHDESELSSNQGNFRELLKFLADHNEETRKFILQNAPKNNKLYSHKIQIDIASSCAIENSKLITEDIGYDYFSILVDECRDVSTKEQMALALRYVNKKGYVIERFLGIVYVPNTNSLSLKAAIDSLLATYKLIVSRIRGQGYDGASNMRGEFNGLKSLILRDNNSAFYVHCFTHQLQLVLVAIVKNHVDIALLFTMISKLVNVVGASCKRKYMLHEKQVEKILEAIYVGEIETDKGLNQEYTLQRATDTQWGSHYVTLLNIGILFSSIIEVLEYVVEDCGSSEQKAEVVILLDWTQSFDFVFALILMKSILGITNELSSTLQRKYQDIVNAMELVGISKQRLMTLGNEGWESLVKEVYLFCEKVNDTRKQRLMTLGNKDWVLQELRSRFNETTTELLLCMACLNLDDSFSSFKKEKLGVGYLAMKLVETKKIFIYHLVYQLIKLVLVLPISTASVERSFSAMKIVKTRLRNKIGTSG
ncbi:uncharacterized protein LOC111878813 [Lactuca sativa]|uniref:uncharacterized protein LOC111878813 n=1 Tax=Lactuca sativa TaxID=4236 RepID=UPI0022AF0AD7|nr:uncharacterized protein LOC111878813 [Lactuca sativa]